MFLFILLGFLFVTNSYSFDSGFFGDDRTTHYGLTKCALLKITAKYLKVVHGSISLDAIATSNELCDNVETMFTQIRQETQRLGISSELRSVIDQICTSNVLVNMEELTSPSSHFDNEAFHEGSILIANRLADVQAKLSHDSLSVFDARQSFGQAMHTLQDFYAHSNWVELGRRVPNENIGTERLLGLYAPTNLETCSNCTRDNCSEHNILPEILSGQYLTSGYFDMFHMSTSKPKGKCSHGGALDSTSQLDAVGFGINKDNENSDHGSYHLLAAEIALTATIQQLESLWSVVGNISFGRFLGFHARSLVIVIDTTGSMTPVIKLVKKIAVAIIEFTRGDNALFRPSNYIFSPFNDPEWGPVIVTNNSQFLIDKIENLNVNGGGDEPELYYHGLNEALALCEPNSIVYTFTDAPAKDAYLRSKVLARAIELKSIIISFYVHRARSSGKHRLREDLIEILDGSANDDLAKATGGETIGLDPTLDIDGTIEFVLMKLFQRQLLLKATVSNTISKTFAVDTNVTRIEIVVTSTNSILNSNLTSNPLHFISSNGTSITPILIASGTYFQIYTIENPRSGFWQLLSNVSYPRTVEISIPETLNMSMLIECRTILSKYIERESNNNYGPLLIAPTINQSDLVMVASCKNLRSPIESATVELINKNGDILSSWKASNITNTGSAIVHVVIPNTDFRMLTTIRLTDGSIVQRQSDALISPTLILIKIHDQPYTFKNNSITPIKFTISNRAQQTLTIRMCALDTLAIFGDSGICRNYTISSMNSTDDSLDVDIKMWLEENNSRNINKTTSGSITFAIDSKYSNNTDLKNYQKIPFYIQTRDQHSNNSSIEPPTTTQTRSITSVSNTETTSTTSVSNTETTSTTSVSNTETRSTTTSSSTPSNRAVCFSYICSYSYVLYLYFLLSFILIYYR